MKNKRCVKLCKYILGEEGWVQNVFGDGPIKVDHCKKNLWNICAWDPPQSIKLIIMNHNKYLSFFESMGKKWWWTKLGI
jgi:hypothetical protein